MWFNLDLLFTSRNLAKLQKKIPSKIVKHTKINWDEFNISIKNDGFVNKKLRISSKNTCITYYNSKLCFKKILFAAKLIPFANNKVVIEKAILIDKEIVLFSKDFSSADPGPVTLIQDKINSLKSLLSKVLNFAPEKIKIAFDNTVVHTSEIDSFNIRALINSVSVNLQVVSNEIKFQTKLAFRKKLKMSEIVTGFLSFNGFKSDVFVKLQLQKSVLDLDVSGSIQEGLVNLNGSKFKIDFEQNKTVLFLVSLDFAVKDYLEKISAKNCSFTLSQQLASNMVLDCNEIGVRLSPKALGKRFKSLPKDLKSYRYMGKVFMFSLKAKLHELILLGSNPGNAGEFQLRLADVDDQFISLKAHFAAQFLKVKASSKTSISLKPKKLYASLVVKSFHQLVRELSGTEFAVPAPLNALDGKVFFKSEKVKDFTDHTSFDFQASTDLTSRPSNKKKSTGTKIKNQDTVNIKVKGQMKLAHTATSKVKTKLTAKVVIGEVILHLPDFNPLGGLPKLNTDPRILPYKLEDRKSGKADSSASTKTSVFEYEIDVETKNKDSIKVKYQYFYPFVPLGFKAKISSSGSSYEVYSNKRWKVDYLKRQIFVKSIRLSKKSLKKDYTTLNVKLIYPATNYKIFIDVIGTTDNPVVKLSSDPLLSRPDIISVLLYNRTTQDLSRFENESVGGAESAIADKALGLIGIWAFASTPIESVSYDSKSQIYRAQIALPGGVKFDIGTNWERVQNLSLRKRLNNSWVFVTSFEPGSENQNGVGNLFLQREWIY